MIRAGQMNQRVAFFDCVETTANPYNAPDARWVLAYVCSAQVKWLRGQRALDEGNLLLTDSVLVTVRASKKIHARQRVMWDGKSYAIASLNTDRRNGQMDITATRVENEDEAGDFASKQYDYGNECDGNSGR